MGAGDDSIAATIAVPATLLGGPGADRLEGGAGGDLLNGGLGQDTVDGAAGRDTLTGEGADVLLGGLGDDAIIAGTGADGSADGGPGTDYVRGDGIENHLSGGEGDDYVDGAGGGDRLYGGSGADILIGGDGSDGLSGDNNEDESVGETNGVDLLYCGPGSDTWAGPGNDRTDGTTCESLSWVGGVGGGYRAAVRTRLHRARGTRPYVEIYVESRAKLDKFKVKLRFLAASGRVVAEPSPVEVPGRRWITLRQFRLPTSVRKVLYDVIT